MSSNISFAQNLQSESGHKAIMFRLESELKILEVLKKFLTIQIRLEKDHSNGVGNATSSAMKAITSVLTESSGGSIVNGKEKVIQSESIISTETIQVLKEIETASSNLKRNVTFLDENTLVELTELISQKKILLKSAQDEYSRIKGTLDHFVDSIKKQKTEYFKLFNSYESSRTKFEDNCSKGHPSDSVKKSEELRDKFFRMKGRLNLSHTEYLLLIQEAKIFDRDFRTILLPSLLQIEQNWCEKQLKQWNQILDDILNNTGAISKEARFKLKEFEFAKEFVGLLERHKSPPLSPMDFKFEPARISSQPVAQSSLIVDSSTVPFLRKKLGDVGKRLISAEANLKEKQTDRNKYKGHELVEDLKSFDILVFKCDIDRLKCLKTFLTSHVDQNSPKLDAISLASEHSLMRKSKGGRFATLLRQAATLSKKSTSFDGESDSARGNFLSSSNVSLGKGNVPNGACAKRDLRVQAMAEEPWFHGVLPREDVIRLLKHEGDYLVRETVKNSQQQLVLSVSWNGHKHFMIQTTADGQFQFEGPVFRTVKDLVSHYVTNRLPITNRSGAMVTRAVNREKWEINNDDVQLIEKIGKGNFGDVYKAVVNGSLVAVKTCKLDLPEDQKRKFLREARILKQYNHPNIVRFIGICAQKQPIMIAMELVPGGSLLTYLKGKGKSLSVKTLIKMTLDTAAGMKYLEERNCLHRDLAARNCLIDQTNTSVKISDFGMSREEHEYTVSDGLKQIPIKWTAPEALNYGKYTTLSDCWSFGILMWEIFSQGLTPYPGMTNSKSREMIEAGYRMPAPDGIPDVIYQLMTRCWQYEPEQRPRFSEIHLELEVVSSSDLI